MTERSPFPSDEEVHDDLMEQLLLGIHVAMPGRIQSYDADRQVADIVVGVRHRYPDPEGSGEYLDESYPVLPAVPVLWWRMGKWFMAASVEPGDAVQLLFNSSAIGIWRRSTAIDDVEGLQRALQGVTTVGDVGRHSLTHAVALLGLETYGNPLSHAPPGAESPDACLRLGHDADEGLRLSLYRDGRFVLSKGTAVRLYADTNGVVHLGGAAGDPVALAPLVDALMASLKARIASWVPVPNDGGASLKAHIATWDPPGVGATKANAT